MVNKYNDIKISLNQAKHILEDKFNLTGNLFPLDGEIDFNFKSETGNGNYLLKISRPDVDIALFSSAGYCAAFL